MNGTPSNFESIYAKQNVFRGSSVEECLLLANAISADLTLLIIVLPEI